MKRKHEGGAGAGGSLGSGTAPPRGQHSRLDGETLSYYVEIEAHFKSLDCAEERQLLADNVLGETTGRAADVATDAACSRVLEALLPAAGTPALAAFTRACVEGESLGAMCTCGPFGSHVLEKCLTQLADRAAAAGQEDYEQIEGALAAASAAAADCFYEMATSKYGSFVARRLLCVLSGRDVAPSSGKKQAPAPDAAGGGEQAQAQAQWQQGPRGGGALAAKLGCGDAAGGMLAGSAAASSAATAGGRAGAGAGVSGAAATADWPELLDKVAGAVLSDDWGGGEEMGRLATDSFAGPVLQALLRACTHNTKLLQRLLLRVLGGAGSKGMEGVTQERCHALMQDRNGSHLMEAVFQSIPDDYFSKLTTLCFKGHLLPLAQHPTANFAVQAAVAALRKPQQLKRMFEDLRPSFPQLLRSRRSGVIAALLAAAGRLGAQEAEVAAALWAAAGQGGSGGGGGGGPLAALLTLDTHTQLGGSGGGRLSTLGCAMAVALLRLPPAACKQWGEVVAALTPGAVRHVARDPGGCRVLEAYLEGPGAPARRRRTLLQALQGAYGEVAAGGGSGSHFVEKCYLLAEVAEKKTIAGELAAAEACLMATHRGPLLLRRCHVDTFKKDSDGWQRRMAAADATRLEFEHLFGTGAGVDNIEGEDGGIVKQQQQGSIGGDAEEEMEEEQAVDKKKAKQKKGTRKRKQGVAADEEAAGGGKQGKKKKKKKQETAAAEEEEQQADGGGQKKAKQLLEGA